MCNNEEFAVNAMFEEGSISLSNDLVQELIDFLNNDRLKIKKLVYHFFEEQQFELEKEPILSKDEVVKQYIKASINLQLWNDVIPIISQIVSRKSVEFVLTIPKNIIPVGTLFFILISMKYNRVEIEQLVEDGTINLTTENRKINEVSLYNYFGNLTKGGLK